MALQRTCLTSGWTFKQADTEDTTFLSVAQFPTCVHLDLMHHGKIVDPFLNDNEPLVQWVGEEAWIYRKVFAAPERKHDETRVEIVFEGLDTYATVFLNGREIQKTDNMYITYRVDITNKLQQGDNELEIRFDSAFLIGRRLEKEAGGPPLFCHNGDSSRLQVRKAPYSYGWDWGPIMLTCGPWRPIYLEAFTTRFSDLFFHIEVPESLSTATINAVAELDGIAPNQVKFELFGPDGALVEEKTSVTLHAEFQLEEPQLWYSIGNGTQPLYTVKATAFSAVPTALCTSSKRIGIRRLELIQRPLKTAPGTTFFFQINNVPVFCRGADWIPADMFLPRITAERYRQWVELMAEGGQNMIRVWGGGIYEDDVFYERCDELGVLVWQDFMLGCGSFPATPRFLKQIEEEAICNLKRMRSHPSIVLWCGNNEDHMFADKYTTQYNVDDKNPENWAKTDWPARVIYDKILSEICSKYAPETPYHPGSPWGGKPSNDSTAGDVHAWDVWMKASAQYPYQRYPEISGRFVSEFGLKAYPTLKTIKEFILDPLERYPQSRMMDAHMKSSSKSTWARDNRTIALYLVENIRHGFKMEQYAYASQFIQAEAMYYAYAGWRRLWKGSGSEECAGVLVWQFNDAWPCVSWSLADYHLRPKYAYFSIKRAIAPISVGVARIEIERPGNNEFTHIHVQKEKRLQIWGSNLTTAEEKLDLMVQEIDISTGNCMWEKTEVVTLLRNQSTELFDEPFPSVSETTIFFARLLKDGKVIARYSDWPQPLRYLDLPSPTVIINIDRDDIHVTSSLPLKGLAFDVGEDNVFFEDNFIDVIPGDDQIIHAKGLSGREISYMHLAMAVD